MTQVSMFELVKDMHRHFGIAYDGTPRQLPASEFKFRVKAKMEELSEYIDARIDMDLEAQLDALVDMAVFIMGAAEQHGFDFEEAFSRVMAANMAKEVVKSASESKRGHKTDLKKPAGWRPPYLGDLTGSASKYKGLVILEGPDACGKTTLAQELVSSCGAYYMHSTWSQELDTRMDAYMWQTLEMALRIAKNQLVVLDRLFLTEVVYATVFRKGTKYPDLARLMDHVTVNAGVPCVHVICAPYDRAKFNDWFVATSNERVEMYSDVSAVWDMFDKLWFGNDIAMRHNSSFVTHVVKSGGLENRYPFIRYDLFAHSDIKDSALPLIIDALGYEGFLEKHI